MHMSVLVHVLDLVGKGLPTQHLSYSLVGKGLPTQKLNFILLGKGLSNLLICTGLWTRA